MKVRDLLSFLLATLMLGPLALPAHAEPVSPMLVTLEDARLIASNWVALSLYQKGEWGGSSSAMVAEVSEFMLGDRLLGYFCRIEPSGYVVVSLRRELAPVKGYSERVNLNPDADEEIVGILKARMAAILDSVELEAGPILQARTEDVAGALAVDHRETWAQLSIATHDFLARLNSDSTMLAYAEVQLPIDTTWRQDYPYNLWCPTGDTCSHTLAGCVATAAAQIMRYWGWPPYGKGDPYDDSYDWANMPNSISSGSPSVQINAVAELSYEVGKAAGTDYGCDRSDAWVGHNLVGADMTDAYVDKFRYSSSADFEQAWHHTNDGWFDIVKTNIDANRPVQYAYLFGESTAAGKAAHSMVCDGYRTVGSTRYFHMNYGWGETCTWDEMTNISGLEGAIRDIKPIQSMGTWLSGWYSVPSFPYRYIYRNMTGYDATFDAGHYLQFLPGVTVTCTSPSGGKVGFRGWSTGNTLLYSNGDKSAGIRIRSGHIYLYQGGSIKFHRKTF